MHKYLTADIPGIGGVIKEQPEDFQVVEIPLYLPCGEGEHTYVEIEKRGITTLEAIRRIARFVDVRERDIGYAGMKDAGGVTRQTLSIPRVAPERFQELALPGLRVLSAMRHRNKLKLGHLAGNRFRVAIRETGDSAIERSEAVLDILRRRGVPNYFGEQRYGAQGNYPRVGRAILLGDFKTAVEAILGNPQAVQDEHWKNAIMAFHAGDMTECLVKLPNFCRTERDIVGRLIRQPNAYDKAFHAVNPRLKKLYLSAYQADLFDRLLDERLEDFDTVREGDLAYKHDNGACFLVDDAEAEARRAAGFEISASGPLFGCKMKLPAGVPLEMEEKLLAGEGITLNQFDLPGGLRMEGDRRPLRIPLKDPLALCAGSSIFLEFSLPRGSYATSVLREIIKP